MSQGDEGLKRLEQLARLLEHEHESAARSLREGMAEMLTIQQLQLPPPFFLVRKAASKRGRTR